MKDTTTFGVSKREGSRGRFVRTILVLMSLSMVNNSWDTVCGRTRMLYVSCKLGMLLNYFTSWSEWMKLLSLYLQWTNFSVSIIHRIDSKLESVRMRNGRSQRTVRTYVRIKNWSDSESKENILYPISREWDGRCVTITVYCNFPQSNFRSTWDITVVFTTIERRPRVRGLHLSHLVGTVDDNTTTTTTVWMIGFGN